MKKMILVISFLATVCMGEVLAQGNGNVGIGTAAPGAKLQINHRSGPTVPALLLFDSTTGKGAGILFQKQGVNNSFTIYSDGNDVYFNPKEITIDKPVPWQFKSNGRLGFGTPNPQGRIQINNKSAFDNPSIVIVDSPGGTGTGISFRKQDSNREFVIASDGANMYYNPKEVGVDKNGHWAFLSTGQTGFGTTSPLGFVQLNHKGSALQPGLVLVDSPGGNGNRIAFRKQGSNKQFRMRTDDFGGQDLELFSINFSEGGVTHQDTWDTQAFTINGKGNVGIGTGSQGARLQVNNNSTKLIPALALVDSPGGVGNMIAFSKLGSEKRFRMTTDDFGGQELELFSIGYAEGGVEHEDRWNTSGFTMNGKGDVGIGTSTQGARLQINNRSSNTLPALMLVDSATGNGNLINLRKQGVSKMFSVISTPSNQEANALLNIGYGADNWATFPSSLLALRGNGRAGFGTTNPSGRVQINHRSTQTEPALILVDSATGTGRMIEFRKENVINSITCTGTVSDGAPPSLQFGFGAIGQPSSDVLIIKGDGKVGINNPAPANALDVNGDVNLTGKLKVNGQPGVAGQVLTSTGVNTPPAWQFPIAQPPGFNAFSDSFTVPAATVIIAMPPNERFDNLNDYNAGTGEFVAPQPSGYALNAHVAICSNSAQGGAQTMHWVLEILNANNTQASKLEKSEQVPSNTPAQCAQFSIYTIQKLGAGQKVRLKVFHSFTGGVVKAIVDEFSAHRLL